MAELVVRDVGWEYSWDWAAQDRGCSGAFGHGVDVVAVIDVDVVAVGGGDGGGGGVEVCGCWQPR